MVKFGEKIVVFGVFLKEPNDSLQNSSFQSALGEMEMQKRGMDFHMKKGA